MTHDLAGPRLSYHHGGWVFRRLLAGGVLAMLALVLGGPASAHDAILGSTPSDGEVLSVTPLSIMMEMSEPPQTIAPRFRVTASNGSVMYDGEPTIDGRFVSTEVPVLPNDTYAVAWRVVSSDGHPIQGVFTFTVDDPAAVVPTPGGSASDDPMTDAAQETGSASDTATTVASSSRAAVNSGLSTSSWVTVAGIGIMILVGALALVVALRRHNTLKEQS